MRSTLIKSATHAAPRTPSIKFLGKHRQPAVNHAPSAHPAAPQSIIDAFPSFLKKLSASSRDNAASTAAAAAVVSQSTPTPAAAASSPSVAALEGEWEMPRWLRRSQYAPTAAEIEAVESGGATVAPIVTKASRHAWYNAAKL